MRKIIDKIKVFPAFLYLFLISARNTLAFVNDDSVTITPPVGGNILPNVNVLQSGNIKDSYIFSTLMPFAIKYGIRLAVALSVLAIIAGGYMYVTAYGDEEKHKKAQHTIIYAILGLILAITAYGIVKVLTNIQI